MKLAMSQNLFSLLLILGINGAFVLAFYCTLWALVRREERHARRRHRERIKHEREQRLANHLNNYSR